MVNVLHKTAGAMSAGVCVTALAAFCCAPAHLGSKDLANVLAPNSRGIG
jgi:hypothetical protein